MRIFIAIPALLILGACNVSKEGNAVTVQYDQNACLPVAWKPRGCRFSRPES